jgi:hypothetical protein
MRTVDFSQIRTVPIHTRQNKANLEWFARPPEPKRRFVDYVPSLPYTLAGEDFRRVVDTIPSAHLPASHCGYRRACHH